MARRDASAGLPDVRKGSLPTRHSGDNPLPGYTLERWLGGGAFGEVWAATGSASHPEGRSVAIKFVSGRGADTGPEADRLRVEWRGLERVKQIRHPFVVSMSAIHLCDNDLTVVTERADADLGGYVRGLWEAKERVSVLMECLNQLWDAAQGLDHIRDAHNLQHGDVKPANLLVFAGRCKVGDFGTVAPLGGAGRSAPGPVILCTPGGTSARYPTPSDVPWVVALRPGATLYTAHGGFTPRYAPPEAFFGRISRSSDQYSLALTFCELVYKRLPFSDEAGGSMEQRRRGEFDLGFVFPPLASALARALSPNPADRFPSCSAFVDHMCQWFTANPFGR
jgi:serine/threonine protein kinase